MDSELLLKVFIFFILGTGQGMGLPNPDWGCVFSSLIISKRLRASDPFIFKKLKIRKKEKKNKGHQNLNHSWFHISFSNDSCSKIYVYLFFLDKILPRI